MTIAQLPTEQFVSSITRHQYFGFPYRYHDSDACNLPLATEQFTVDPSLIEELTQFAATSGSIAARHAR